MSDQVISESLPLSSDREEFSLKVISPDPLARPVRECFYTLTEYLELVLENVPRSNTELGLSVANLLSKVSWAMSDSIRNPAVDVLKELESGLKADVVSLGLINERKKVAERQIEAGSNKAAGADVSRNLTGSSAVRSGHSSPGLVSLDKMSFGIERSLERSSGYSRLRSDPFG